MVKDLDPLAYWSLFFLGLWIVTLGLLLGILVSPWAFLILLALILLPLLLVALARAAAGGPRQRLE
jgi:hypothetical protein